MAVAECGPWLREPSPMERLGNWLRETWLCQSRVAGAIKSLVDGSMVPASPKTVQAESDTDGHKLPLIYELRA